MNRTKQITVAAALTVALGIASMLSGTRILASGSAGSPPMPGAEEMGGPPFWAGLMFLTMGVAYLFGAYGMWKNQKWGKVLAVVLSAINGFFTLGDILGTVVFQQYAFTVVFAVLLLACLAVIVLVLRREPNARAA